MRPFEYVVVLAGMRTGSNLLEEQLASMPGVTCHGELFNPHFFGKPGKTRQFGIELSARDSNPSAVISAVKSAPDLNAFRLFYDHDPRVIEQVLTDPRAAKVVLSRRAIDSYVSLKVARKTGQWWLGDMASAKAAKVTFDADEYTDFVETLAAFKSNVLRTLQTTGQTGFFLTYDDLSDGDVLGGLSRFIGADGPPAPQKVRAKVQNTNAVSARLTNPRAAEDALRQMRSVDLDHLPIFEPDRGPGLRLFRAAQTVPLLYMPIRGAGFDPVPDWLKAVDPSGSLDSGLTQKQLRQWKRKRPGHVSFTVLRHPLPRAYDAFQRFILPSDQEAYADVRAALVNRYGVPLPKSNAQEWSLDDQRSAFSGFLKFVEGNIGGQTSLRVDSTWASQGALLQAISQFAVPDRIIREDHLAADLALLVDRMGYTSPHISGFSVPTAHSLVDVRTPKIDKACERAYRRDYVMFGFGRWEPSRSV